ncbi:carboxypeptidase-like regulatory domain-containing protein [Janthinobacterium kumbetense]|uniref:Carboxypeptidase-like regulatory domain-containing protein n=1 Tax=Janthinobacterium kumbetense TaxID=2950280 RepID=A0ABT0WV82_9BURK|nr:carboxypeptidase-like regulatory domain-containing protein [Janthinobacterium kumbetense]MCM2567950.1 carboxypeptidase-like regulatory domain-containing protein [Janthinobacterium kumbetense]
MASNRRGTLGLAAAVLAAGLLLGSAAQAQADNALPPVQKSGAVEYLSGGIGLDESTAIKSASRHWPLSLVFSVQAAGKAEFASDVKLQISDAKGMSVLETSASGPFLLAKLPPGNYSLRATLAGKTLERKVQVKAGSSARVELVWPAGTNQGRP